MEVFKSYDEYVELYKNARCYQLEPGDIFSIDRRSAKLFGLLNDDKFLLMYPRRVWFKPKTWFPRYYKFMYRGEQKQWQM